jgi:hypothetical protein
MSEEGSEENIEEGNEYVGGKKKFEQNKEDYKERNAYGNDDTVHGHGVKRTNSNIMGRHWFKWRRAKFDFVDDGVFIAKSWMVACDP